MKPSKLLATLFLPLSIACTTHINAATVLEDHFDDYKTENALRNSWQRVSESGSFPSLGKDTEVNAGKPYLILSNALYRKELPKKLTDSWKLSFRLRHTNIQRGTWIGLFEASGKRGYAVLWDSGNPASGVSNGSISIRKFDLTDAPVSWQQLGDALTRPKDSGHVATQEPLAQFEFSWDSNSGQLQVSVDGKSIASVVDKNISEFSAIYIRGNQSQYYADIVVSDISTGQ